MNIADFFIDKYQQIEAERDELRQELDAIKATNKDYGVFDLGQGIDMVNVNVDSYYMDMKTLNVVKLGSERIQELIEKPQDELISWAKSFELGSYHGKVLTVKYGRYRYTIKIVDMDGETVYAFDPRKDDDLVKIGKREYSTEEWAPEVRLGSILESAYGEIVEALRSALTTAKNVEAMKAAQEEAEDADHE